jgi:hypothetical protein
MGIVLSVFIGCRSAPEESSFLDMVDSVGVPAGNGPYIHTEAIRDVVDLFCFSLSNEEPEVAVALVVTDPRSSVGRSEVVAVANTVIEGPNTTWRVVQSSFRFQPTGEGRGVAIVAFANSSSDDTYLIFTLIKEGPAWRIFGVEPANFPGEELRVSRGD